MPNGEGEPVWMTHHQRDSQPEGEREISVSLSYRRPDLMLSECSGQLSFLPPAGRTIMNIASTLQAIRGGCLLWLIDVGPIIRQHNG